MRERETEGQIMDVGQASVENVNPWVPSSPCGQQCVGVGDRVSSTRAFLRLTAFLSVGVWYLSFGVLTPLLPRRVRHRYWRSGARASLRAMGVRLEIDDHRPAHARRVRGALIVANHVSYLDIVAIAAIAPARFVAKAEVLQMGGFGPVARAFGVLSHQRGDLRALPPLLGKVTGILDRGRAVAVFPEGTTWCGAASGRFRPAFFQTAVDAGVPVLPIRVSYTAAGRPTALAGFIGGDTIFKTFGRVVNTPKVAITLTVFEPQLPAPDRKQLAVTAQRLIAPATDLSDRVEMVQLRTTRPTRAPRPMRAVG